MSEAKNAVEPEDEAVDMSILRDGELVLVSKVEIVRSYLSKVHVHYCAVVGHDDILWANLDKRL